MNAFCLSVKCGFIKNYKSNIILNLQLKDTCNSTLDLSEEKIILFCKPLEAIKTFNSWWQWSQIFII